MISDDAMFESLSKTAQNRKRLSEMTRRYISVAVLRLGMDAGEIVSLTGYSRPYVRSLIDRIDGEATEADRAPAHDPVAGRERIESELPEIVATHQQAEDLVQSIARSCVLKHEMSANELARRTGHSRDYCQKWVKRMRSEPDPEPAPPVPAPGDAPRGWHTPTWEEDSPVDPKYIITVEEAQRRQGGAPRADYSEFDVEMYLI